MMDDVYEGPSAEYSDIVRLSARCFLVFKENYLNNA